MERPVRAFSVTLVVAAVALAVAALLLRAPWLAIAAVATMLLAGAPVPAAWFGGRVRSATERRRVAAEQEAAIDAAAQTSQEVAVTATPQAPEPAVPEPTRPVVPQPATPTPAATHVFAQVRALPALPALTRTIAFPPATSTAVLTIPAMRPSATHAGDAPAVGSRLLRERPARSVQPGVASWRAPVSPEPVDVLEALLEAGNRAGRPVSASLWLADAATGTARRIAAVGPLPPAEDFEKLSDSLLGDALDSDASRLAPVARVKDGEGEALVWRFAVPLSTGDARGVVALDIAGAKPENASLMSAANGLRAALTGALALHVARIETHTAKELVEAARDLSRLLEPDIVATTTLERAMRIADASTGSIMLLGEDGRLRIAAARGLPPEVVERTELIEGEGIAGWVLASRTHLVVEDLEGRRPESRRHGVRSSLSVPIADEDGVLGVLNVGSRTMQPRFTSSQVDALETLGRCAAVSLRNARAAVTSADMYFDSLKALALALETKDPYSRGGTERVLGVTESIGRAMGFDDEELLGLRIAALLHDIGMDAAGEGVATEARPLSTVEWSMVKMHPAIAAEILERAPALCEVVPIVFHHHERYDGGGYCAGVSGERIPIGARILAVADGWVAMTSDRPYRRAMDDDEALAELQAQAGTQFDPLVVETLVELVRAGRLEPVGAQ